MCLETEQAGAYAAKLKQSLVHPPGEVDPHRCHVAHDLGRGLLESEVQRPLATLAGRDAELGRDSRLARSGGAADEHRAPAVKTFAAEHLIEAFHPAGHSLHRSRVLQADGGDGQDGHTIGADQEWILVRAMERAAVLQDT